jgi:hypothetical protein
MPIRVFWVRCAIRQQPVPSETPISWHLWPASCDHVSRHGKKLIPGASLEHMATTSSTVRSVPGIPIGSVPVGRGIALCGLTSGPELSIMGFRRYLVLRLQKTDAAT